MSGWWVAILANSQTADQTSGIPDWNTVRDSLKTLPAGTASPKSDPRPFDQALESALRLFSATLKSSGIGKVQAAVGYTLIACGIPLDRFRLIQNSESVRSSVAEDADLPFATYTADGYVVVDLPAVVKWVLGEIQTRTPQGYSLSEDVFVRLLTEGITGILIHEHDERRLWRQRLTEELVRQENMSYREADAQIRDYFRGTPASSSIQEARQTLSVPERILERHAVAEKLWSVSRFRAEIPAYGHHQNRLTEIVMQELKGKQLYQKSNLLSAKYWEHFFSKSTDPAADALTARWIVATAYERITHRKAYNERTRWNETAVCWGNIVAAEIARTEWRETEHPQSPLGKLDWGHPVVDHRPPEEGWPLFPRLIPASSSDRHLTRLRDVLLLMQSRGPKIIEIPDDATLAQIHTFIRLLHILDTPFFYHEGLATGGTQENPHEIEALFWAGLRDDAPTELKELANSLIAIFEEEFPAYAGRTRSEKGGADREGVLGQLDDYHITDVVYKKLSEKLKTSKGWTKYFSYGDVHFDHKVVSKLAANAHIRAPQANLNIDVDSMVAEFTEALELTYVGRQHHGIGTTGHDAFNEPVTWFFYRFFRWVPLWQLRRALAEGAYDILYAPTPSFWTRLRQTALNLMAAAPWMKGTDSPDHYGRSWTHRAIITDLTRVQNFFDIVPEGRDDLIDYSKMIYTFMGAYEILDLEVAKQEMKKALESADSSKIFNLMMGSLPEGNKKRVWYKKAWQEWQQKGAFEKRWTEFETVFNEDMFVDSVTQGMNRVLAHGRYQDFYAGSVHKWRAVEKSVYDPVNDNFTVSIGYESPWTTFIVTQAAIPPINPDGKLTADEADAVRKERERISFVYEPAARTVELFTPAVVHPLFEKIRNNIRAHIQKLFPPSLAHLAFSTHRSA